MSQKVQSMSSGPQEALGCVQQQSQSALALSVHAQNPNSENIAMRNVPDQLQHENANVLDVTQRAREREREKQRDATKL